MLPCAMLTWNTGAIAAAVGLTLRGIALPMRDFINSLYSQREATINIRTKIELALLKYMRIFRSSYPLIPFQKGYAGNFSVSTEGFHVYIHLLYKE